MRRNQAPVIPQSSVPVFSTAVSTLVAALPAVMFDCHAHLTDSSLAEGLRQTLLEAEAAGVTGIVAVSESLEDAVPVRCPSPTQQARNTRTCSLQVHTHISLTLQTAGSCCNTPAILSPRCIGKQFE